MTHNDPDTAPTPLAADLSRRTAMAATVATAISVARSAQAATPVAPYQAACVQTRVVPTFGPNGADAAALAANVETTVDALARGANDIGARLYVFSEFGLQLAKTAAPVQSWLDTAITIPGPEIDRIAKAAQAARAYVVINPIERIPTFPGRYFLSGVVIGPTGNVEVNYRKLYDLSNKTRPSDILDAWLAKFGADSLFPVADTEIGRIGCAVALDINWPEMLRSLVFKGAEIIVNPTASPISAPGYSLPDAGGGLDIRTMVRRVRALENLAYVITTNLGPVGPDKAAPLTPMVPSEIVDYRGRALASARDSAEGFTTATLDIEALRRARCTPEALNGLSQLQVELHQNSYRTAKFARVNAFGKKPIQSADEQKILQHADIEALVRRGVFKAPAT